MTTDTLPNDQLLLDIADYVEGYEVKGDVAFEAARLCLLDSLACALEALDHPDCVRLLGPVVPGASVTHGARVPGTAFVLDPVKAAFDISSALRWLDLSDTWISTTTTHPSDDIGAILAVADYLSRVNASAGKPPLTMQSVLEAIIKAHEIQGGLGAEFAMTDHGIDNVYLTKIACAAVLARMLGGGRAEIAAAVSLALFEPSLCLHRFGSNTGPRKSWAGGDAGSDAVRFAMMAVKGEPGYPQVMTHPKWGVAKSFLGGRELHLLGPMGTAVIEGVFYKLHPVVIHAQASIECALQLHPVIRERIDDIAQIRITTHRQPIMKIVKSGPLRNAADRDHCLQYAVAVALLRGKLKAHDYEDVAAADPRIDQLRSLMTVTESQRYNESYLDKSRRANPTAIEVCFKDGSSSGVVEVEYPAGHPRRRKEAMPMLLEKFHQALALRFPAERQRAISAVCLDHQRMLGTPVSAFTELFAN